ncbi:recombination protein RecR [Patescibacteria group bacterium]|nr:recombination protein RecR [Patescibacteria group bacterium]MBP9710433.1 recombination protein RecR [Patescibacteria group bacterium]
MPLPEPIHDAAAAFDSLPGVGPRAALRYAYWLVTQPRESIERFARSVQKLASSIAHCSVCHQWADRSPCSICSNSSRDQAMLCVLATSQDVQSVEETGVFKGRYHVLGGTLDPIEGRTPDTLTIASLLTRLREPSSPIREVILALDADLPGDTTTLYLRKQLSPLGVKVTRLARGLPTGAALEYADAHTLADALVNRKES